MNTIDRLFNSKINGLTKALDLSQRRNEAIASNIANAETPGYRARDLDFAGELEKAFGEQTGSVQKTNAKHLDVSSNEGNAHMVEDLQGATKPDGNNVDIDMQMGQLAQNAGRYTSAASLLRKQIGMIKLAIREGAR